MEFETSSPFAIVVSHSPLVPESIAIHIHDLEYVLRYGQAQKDPKRSEERIIIKKDKKQLNNYRASIDCAHRLAEKVQKTLEEKGKSILDWILRDPGVYIRAISVALLKEGSERIFNEIVPAACRSCIDEDILEYFLTDLHIADLDKDTFLTPFLQAYCAGKPLSTIEKTFKRTLKLLKKDETKDHPDCEARYNNLVYLSDLYINLDTDTTAQAQRRDQLLYYLIKKNKPKLLNIRYFKALFEQHCQEAKDITTLNKYLSFARAQEYIKVIAHIKAITAPYEKNHIPEKLPVTRPEAQSPSKFSLARSTPSPNGAQSPSKLPSARSTPSPKVVLSPSTASAFSTLAKESPPPTNHSKTFKLLNSFNG